MNDLLNVFAILVTAGLTVWLVGVMLLRMICVSLAVFAVVTLLLAGQGEQDPAAPFGLGALAGCFWMAWQVLHRLRYGWWRSARAAWLLSGRCRPRWRPARGPGAGRVAGRANSRAGSVGRAR